MLSISKVIRVVSAATLAVAAFAAPARAIPLTGLVGAYFLNGNGNDSSGNGNNGVVTGSPTAVADRFGNANGAYSFANDSTQFIALPTNLFGSTTAATISIWFYAPQVVDQRVPQRIDLFTAVVSGGVDQISLDIGDVTGAWNNEVFGINPAGTSSNRTGVSAADYGSPTVPVGWHHVVVSSDPTGHRYYFDGVKYTSLLVSGSWTAATDLFPLATLSQIRINGTRNTPSLPFIADDVLVYNRALSDAEVMSIYTNAPEPSTLLLCATGLAAAVARRRARAGRQLA